MAENILGQYSPRIFQNDLPFGVACNSDKRSLSSDKSGTKNFRSTSMFVFLVGILEALRVCNLLLSLSIPQVTQPAARVRARSGFVGMTCLLDSDLCELATL